MERTIMKEARDGKMTYETTEELKTRNWGS